VVSFISITILVRDISLLWNWFVKARGRKAACIVRIFKFVTANYMVLYKEQPLLFQNPHLSRTKTVYIKEIWILTKISLPNLKKKKRKKT